MYYSTPQLENFTLQCCFAKDLSNLNCNFKAMTKQHLSAYAVMLCKKKIQKSNHHSKWRQQWKKLFPFHHSLQIQMDLLSVVVEVQKVKEEEKKLPKLWQIRQKLAQKSWLIINELLCHRNKITTKKCFYDKKLCIIRKIKLN